MSTKRFALDKDGKRVLIGSKVFFKNKIYIIEDIEYLSWNVNQYLTLSEVKNKNKKIHFVSSHEISLKRGTN
jgi:hypothetical protein